MPTIADKIKDLLQDREFISVSTCDFESRPNAAPKFLLKVESNFVYLVDYVIGRTFQNLKANPRASLSFMDIDSLRGYQINGKVEVIESGPAYDDIVKEILQRQIDLSTKRIAEGVVDGRVHENFEISLSESFVIFKVQVEEVVEMGLNGIITRQRL